MAECLADPHAQANPASATHGPGSRRSERVEAARARGRGADRRARRARSSSPRAPPRPTTWRLLGVARAALRARAGRGHIVSSRTEHKSVLDALQTAREGRLRGHAGRAGRAGRVPPEAVRAALRADTLLVSLMLVNNEIGVLNGRRRDRGSSAARAASSCTPTRRRRWASCPSTSRRSASISCR